MSAKLATCKTGDVLCCYGKGLVSAIISYLTPRLTLWRKAPSHVAIVAIHDDGLAYVHESTTLSKMLDALDGKQRRGVQAHLLDHWLAGYNGRVELRRLKVPLVRAGDALAYLLKLHDRKTGYSIKHALGSALPVRNSEDGKPLFCSAVVAFALQKGGALGSHVNCNELTPWDVANLKCLGKPEALK